MIPDTLPGRAGCLYLRRFADRLVADELLIFSPLFSFQADVECRSVTMIVETDGFLLLALLKVTSTVSTRQAFHPGPFDRVIFVCLDIPFICHISLRSALRIFRNLQLSSTGMSNSWADLVCILHFYCVDSLNCFIQSRPSISIAAVSFRCSTERLPGEKLQLNLLYARKSFGSKKDWVSIGHHSNFMSNTFTMVPIPRLHLALGSS